MKEELNLDFPYQTETYTGCYDNVATKARMFTFTVKGLQGRSNNFYA